MPIINESKKNIDRDPITGKDIEVNFDVRSINILSANEATLTTSNSKIAIGVDRILKFCCKMSRLDGGKDELKFQSIVIVKDLNKATNQIEIKGDLIQAINLMTRSFISENTQKEALKLISEFAKEEKKENSIGIGYTK